MIHLHKNVITVDLLTNYISVMTEAQYDRYEDMILGIKTEAFTMREVFELEQALTKFKNDHF